MNNEIEVYYPQKIYELIRDLDKQIISNYLLSKLELKKILKRKLELEVKKYYDLNSILTERKGKEYEVLNSSMILLEEYINHFMVDTLKSSLIRKKSLKRFILVTNPLSVYLSKKV